MSTDSLVIAGAQIAPAWLDRAATIAKVVRWVHQAADTGAQLVAFGEALIPGYPFWIEYTDGARFNDAVQKSLHAHYLHEAVQIEAGHLDPVRDAARARGITVIVGCMERPSDRGGHSVYASLVYIDATGEVRNVHRKLVPTHEERLSWAPGDGHGLRTFPLGSFTVGALNCWENWMPLARASLYGQGEDLHVAIWPGSVKNTEHITRTIAREGRSYVLSVGGVLTRADIPDSMPHAELLRERCPEVMGEGGTCIAGPDGEWIVEPKRGGEQLVTATIEHRRVLEERQNYDAVGHYARADVLQLSVNRERQTAVKVVP